MKRSVILLILLLLGQLTGCASRLPENAHTLDREAAMTELSQRIERVGYRRVRISPGVDEFLNVAAAILEQQAELMYEYRIRAEFHRDVQAFLWAYQGASTDELQAAARAFDAQASADEDKIAPKLAAYQLANRRIQERNRALAVEISAQMLVAGYLLKEHRDAVMVFALANMLSGLTGGHGNRTHDNDLILALLRARDQLQLAREANALIRIEQATIAAIDDLQRDLERLNQ
ncbi:hypothetical protein [Aliidiomarina haloalkalitolerans]|uniref:Uncharacterized protein n=1 Tax=Aliidiomarina haloalkalitolerans TaxID=859059 RepID=A0A432VYN3_9GAMM|nr:hypothetical protein [Aliidiomarina haloalkalitolerans]MCL4409325.1 hypothetical protein [Gammaproteobacteria bacterium]RUO21776.1 hypothetical protein CWE06_02710 [Aliidiomarina haloalkalitolerans]